MTSAVRVILDAWAEALVNQRPTRSKVRGFRTRKQEPVVSPQVLDLLEEALVLRENGIADMLRAAGAQFGMFPFIVAEVLRQTGLGTPGSEEEQNLIRSEYIRGMNELIEAQRRAQEGDGN